MTIDADSKVAADKEWEKLKTGIALARSEENMENFDEYVLGAVKLLLNIVKDEKPELTIAIFESLVLASASLCLLAGRPETADTLRNEIYKDTDVIS